jgi:hypothetical protein
MNELTGLSRSVYDVTVLTEIQLEGEIGGRAYEETISPALHFGLDAVQLYLRRDADEGTDPLNWQQNGQLRGTRRVANTLSFFGLELPVLPIRIISVIGIIVSIAGLVLLSLPILSPSKDEVAIIHARYGSLIIHVQALPPQKKSQPSITVQSMDELARLAQQAGVLILETVQGNEHRFTVILETGTYTYTAHVVTENEIAGG